MTLWPVIYDNSAWAQPGSPTVQTASFSRRRRIVSGAAISKRAARLCARRSEASQRQAAGVAVIEWGLQAHLQGGKQYGAQISADK